MSDPYVGQIVAVGFAWAPEGWALCDGSLVPITTSSKPLFQVIGTTYGGDGVNNFALPNLCGRVPLGTGQGGGLSPYKLGDIGGAESVSLTANQAGAHAHGIAAANTATGPDPNANSIFGTPASGENFYASSGPATTLVPSTISNSGGNLPHENRQPFMVINYIIAMQGINPT